MHLFKTDAEVFKWMLNLHPVAFNLLIKQYNANFLSDRYARVLEAIEAMADD
jgi:hypothetical protein